MSTPTPPADPAPRSTTLCATWATTGDLPESVMAWFSMEQWDTYLLNASEILFALAGHQYLGQATPPCSATALIRSHPAGSSPVSGPYLETWGQCGCWWWTAAGWWWGKPHFLGVHPQPVTVRLPGQEAIAVQSVVQADATVIDPSAYRLEGQWLRRVDGHSWSLCGDIGPTTVTYTFGRAPDEGGVRAAVALAIEIGKFFRNDQSCQLPSRATSVTRQGVTITLDPVKFMTERKTGIAIVDLWLNAVNPFKRTRRARVFSPDMPTAYRG